MEEDGGWEDAAFNTRHLHNHNDRGGRPGDVRHEFQVRSTMGTHLIKCAALDRLQLETGDRAQAEAGTRSAKAGGRHGAAAGPAGTSNKKNKAADGGGDVVLEIYRLTDGEDGLLGSLRCGSVFEATVAFAGSRKTLGKITRELGGADPERPGASPPRPHARAGAGSTRSSARDKGVAHDAAAMGGKHHGAGEDGGGGGSGADDSGPSSDQEVNSGDAASPLSGEGRWRQRAATFEKNSFRQPKFWFRWQGIVAADGVPLDTTGDGDTSDRARVHGSGYLVFSGNDCRRFQGTMTSERMGWNNVKMTGWKTKPQPERDFEIQWSGEF